MTEQSDPRSLCAQARLARDASALPRTPRDLARLARFWARIAKLEDDDQLVRQDGELTHKAKRLYQKQFGSWPRSVSPSPELRRKMLNDFARKAIAKHRARNPDPQPKRGVAKVLW